MVTSTDSIYATNPKHDNTSARVGVARQPWRRNLRRREDSLALRHQAGPPGRLKDSRTNPPDAGADQNRHKNGENDDL